MGAVRRSTLSVLFIIKKSEFLKNGEVSICICITVNKRVAEVISGRYDGRQAYVVVESTYCAFQKNKSVIGGFFQSVRTYGKTRQWNEEDNKRLQVL